MGLNTSRYKSGESPSATYWRRRFIALVGGLAIFALLAWSVSGALGGVNVVSPAANVAGDAGHGPGGGGARHGAAPGTAPHPTPASSSTGHAASPGPAAAKSPKGRPAPARGRPHGSAHSRPHGSAHGRPHGKAPAKPQGGPPACAGSQIVVSLFASQVSYPAHSMPEFEVDVVSTAKNPCTFNVGAAHLALVIKAGSVRVWSSADCAQGRKSLVTDLVKGVPTTLPISWDRKTSWPGCKLAPSAVPAGTYSATAWDGKLSSNTESFRLR